MATPENDALEDLAYGSAEGAADPWEAGGEDQGEYGEYGEGGDLGEYGEYGEGGDPGEFGEYGDAYEPDAGEYAEFGAEDGLGVEASPESVNQTIASMLGAESEDEFFGKLVRGARNILKKVAPIAGVVGKIAQFIPHPAAQGVAMVANTLSKMRAEGASTEDALEAVAELAARETRAVPIVAGLAARSVLKNSAARLPPTQRQQVTRAITRATTNLIQAAGPAAVRAVPRIVASVNRTAANNGTPPQARPKVLARTISRLAQNPSAVQNLSAPSRRARRILASI
jgi:hypothetical protein